MSEETIYTYTRDEPIWWHPRNKPEPIPGYFVMYRKSKVIVDVLRDGKKWRKMSYLNAIRPRVEEGETT